MIKYIVIIPAIYVISVKSICSGNVRVRISGLLIRRTSSIGANIGTGRDTKIKPLGPGCVDLMGYLKGN